MSCRLLLVFAFLSGWSLASAQDPAPTSNPPSIAGTVVREPGSQPLKKALVQVIAENQNGGGNYTASTDTDGHFRIDSIAPGSYRIFIEKTGFVGVNNRGAKSEINAVTVQPGQSIEDLLFRMLPTAVVTGRVTDEDGDPMSGVRVIALRKVPGKAKKETDATEATNDLGQYRLSSLFPGQYWIVAVPSPDFRDYEQHERSQPADHPGDTPPDTRYLTTYYPGTYDSAQASAVALKAGDEMPINLTLIPSRTYRIRGVVIGLNPGQKPLVELLSKAGDSIHANQVGPDGQFELRGVGPGSYVLKATSGNESQTLTARQEITVVSGDVEGIKLAPQSSFAVSGHLRIEGNSPQDLTHYSVNLRTAELPDDPGFFMSQEFFGANAPVDRMGNFAWKDVNPGNYIVQLYGGDGQGNFFLKSVTLSGHDVETGFSISGPATLEAVVSTKSGAIAGTVLEKESPETVPAKTDATNNDQGNVGQSGDDQSNPTNVQTVNSDHPVPNATVVAVPEEKFRKLPDHFGIGLTDQHGRFTIRGLSPGSYTLYAWQDLDENIYRDPDFLKSQEANGTSAKVEEGSSQTVDLKLSPVGEEWR